MSRISLFLVAACVAAGVVGFAECDTCDDFPAPCTGPNCGQNQPGTLDYLPNGPGGGPVPMGATMTGNMPSNDMAGPAPMAPMPTPETPMTNPTSPPTLMEPARP